MQCGLAGPIGERNAERYTAWPPARPDRRGPV